MVVELCTSAEVLNQFLRQDEIFIPSSSDGCSKEKIDCTPALNSGMVRVWTCVEFGKVVGYVYLKRRNEIVWELHTGFLEPYRGSYAMDALRTALALQFQSEPLCRKINAGIPSDNRVARQMAVALGFEREGVDRCSFLRGGVILDTICYGVTRDAWCQRLSIRQ